MNQVRLKLLGTEHRFRQDLNSTGLLSKIITWKGRYRASKLGDRSDSRFQIPRSRGLSFRSQRVKEQRPRNPL